MKKELNKRQLMQLETLLSDRGMLPCDSVHVYMQPADDLLPLLMICKVAFIKGEKTQTITLADEDVDINELQKQLWGCFGREEEDEMQKCSYL